MPAFLVRANSAEESPTRELSRGTFEIFNYPLPSGGSYNSIGNVLVEYINPSLSIEYWFLFENFVSPVLLSGGVGTSIVVRAATPGACAAGLSEYTWENLPTHEVFVAAMTARAQSQGKSFSILKVRCEPYTG